MKAIILLLTLSCSLMLASFNSEPKPKKFVLFIVEEADTQLEAIKIDKYMRAQAGVLMSRMDITSKKYYVVFKSDQNYDEAYFKSTFKKLGFDIKCFNKGTHGVDKVTNLSLDCE